MNVDEADKYVDAAVDWVGERVQGASKLYNDVQQGVHNLVNNVRSIFW